jgi:hypothetical protein
MLSERMRANCSGTASFRVASPSPVKANACPTGKAASNRMGGLVRFATNAHRIRRYDEVGCLYVVTIDTDDETTTTCSTARVR